MHGSLRWMASQCSLACMRVSTRIVSEVSVGSSAPANLNRGRAQLEAQRRSADRGASTKRRGSAFAAPSAEDGPDIADANAVRPALRRRRLRSCSHEPRPSSHSGGCGIGDRPHRDHRSRLRMPSQYSLACMKLSTRTVSEVLEGSSVTHESCVQVHHVLVLG